MNKDEKRIFLKAALSGNKAEVQKILKSNEMPLFIGVSKGLYCTFEHTCECKEPDKCTYAKPGDQLKALYPNAMFIDVPRGDYSEQARLMAEFEASQEEINAQLAKNPAPGQTRNDIIQLINKFEND